MAENRDRAEEIEAHRLDVRRHRKAKKRRRAFAKFLGFIVLIILCATVYITRDRWLPFFDGIATRYLPKAENSGELAEGNFPLTISGGAEYSVLPIDGSSFALLEDTHFSVYDYNGKELYDTQHGYSNATMKASSSRRVLVYDMGGYSFSLEGKYKNVYSKKLENQIIYGNISSNGYAAIVTLSDKSLCMLSVFDNNGNPIYYYHCTSGRITNVEFTRSGDGIIVTEVSTKGGQLISKLSKFRFSEEQPVWTADGLDTLIFDVEIRSDGMIIAFGDTRCAYYDKDGDFIGGYTYKNDLVHFAESGEMTVLLTENEERRSFGLITFSDITGEITEIKLNENVKAIQADGSLIYVMTDNNVTLYSMTGMEINKVSVSSSYDGFMRLGDYIYLLGYADINRTDFRS